MDTYSRSPMQATHRQDTQARQTAITFALKIATIIAATVIMFYTNLTIVFNYVLKNETAVYIVAVPFVFLYLVYHNRKMLRAVMPLDGHSQPGETRNLASLSGILLVATAILLYWQSSYTYTYKGPHIYVFTPHSLQILELPIFAAGLVLILFNQQTLKQLALPLAFLFFLFPPFSETSALAIMCGFILAIMGTAIFLVASERTSKTHNLALNPAKCDQCNPESPANTTYCRACGRIFRLESARFHKTDVAKIAIILLTASLLLTMQSPVFTTNYIIPVVKTSPLQYSPQILPDIDQYSLQNGTEDQHLTSASLDLLCLEYEYFPLSNESPEVFVGIEMSSSQSNLPEYALPKETKLLPNSPNTIQIYTNYSSPISAQYLVIVYNKSSEYLAILHWISPPVLRIGQTAQHEQVQTQLTISTFQTDKLPALEPELVQLATNITNYWLARSNLPGETWAEAAARPMSDDGLDISLALSIVLVATLMYYVAETRKQRRASLNAVSKLNTLDAQIVRALQRTSKPTTLGNLAATLQKYPSQTITTEQLETRLRDLENVGIIRSQVSSQNSIPVQTWKI
jgi:hypothetical protein